MHLEIERGVSLLSNREIERQKFEVLNRLEVGDSVVITDTNIYQIRSACQWREKRYGKKFRCRTLEDKSGIRAHRIG